MKQATLVNNILL